MKFANEELVRKIVGNAVGLAAGRLLNSALRFLIILIIVHQSGLALPVVRPGDHHGDARARGRRTARHQR